MKKLATALWMMMLMTVTVAAAECPPLLDFSQRQLASEKVVRLCEAYRGQVLLVVNTASKCAFTPQYAGLEKLYARYQSQGFAVLGFPSNDFGAQEPHPEKQVRQFCTLTYSVAFPMFAKASVKQGHAIPFYEALAAAAGEYPTWNFHKYLIGRDGRMITSFPSAMRPDDARLVRAIEAALSDS